MQSFNLDNKPFGVAIGSNPFYNDNPIENLLKTQFNVIDDGSTVTLQSKENDESDYSFEIAKQNEEQINIYETKIKYKKLQNEFDKFYNMKRLENGNGGLCPLSNYELSIYKNFLSNQQKIEIYQMKIEGKEMEEVFELYYKEFENSEIVPYSEKQLNIYEEFIQNNFNIIHNTREQYSFNDSSDEEDNPWDKVDLGDINPFLY